MVNVRKPAIRTGRLMLRVPPLRRIVLNVPRMIAKEEETVDLIERAKHRPTARGYEEREDLNQ